MNNQGPPCIWSPGFSLHCRNVGLDVSHLHGQRVSTLMATSWHHYVRINGANTTRHEQGAPTVQPMLPSICLVPQKSMTAVHLLSEKVYLCNIAAPLAGCAAQPWLRLVAALCAHFGGKGWGDSDPCPAVFTLLWRSLCLTIHCSGCTLGSRIITRAQTSVQTLPMYYIMDTKHIKHICMFCLALFLLLLRLLSAWKEVSSPYFTMLPNDCHLLLILKTPFRRVSSFRKSANTERSYQHQARCQAPQNLLTGLHLTLGVALPDWASFLPEDCCPYRSSCAARG